MYNDGNQKNNVNNKPQTTIYRGLENIRDLKWEEAKTYILPCLAPVGWEYKMGKMEQLVYSSFLNLSVYYYIKLIYNNENKIKTAWINHAILRNWDITMHTLKTQALENMDGDGYSIQPINRILSTLGEESVLEDTVNIPLYILTNQSAFLGAAGILNEHMIAVFAEKTGKDLYIIPSSIHELLLLPNSGHIDIGDLKQMVREVNNSQVEPQDRLSYHIYYYDQAKDKIQIEK